MVFMIDQHKVFFKQVDSGDGLSEFNVTCCIQRVLGEITTILNNDYSLIKWRAARTKVRIRLKNDRLNDKICL